MISFLHAVDTMAGNEGGYSCIEDPTNRTKLDEDAATLVCPDGEWIGGVNKLVASKATTVLTNLIMNQCRNWIALVDNHMGLEQSPLEWLTENCVVCSWMSAVDGCVIIGPNEDIAKTIEELSCSVAMIVEKKGLQDCLMMCSSVEFELDNNGGPYVLTDNWMLVQSGNHKLKEDSIAMSLTKHTYCAELWKNSECRDIGSLVTKLREEDDLYVSTAVAKTRKTCCIPSARKEDVGLVSAWKYTVRQGVRNYISDTMAKNGNSIVNWD